MSTTPHPSRRTAFGLLAAALATVVIWQLPFGSLALYPFTLLATWYHETGHAVAALAAGLSVQGIAIYANGSGLATSVGETSLWGRILVSASGPLGPAVVGAALIWSSRWPKVARLALGLLAATMLVTDLVWIRSVTGLVVIGLMGAALAWLAVRGSLRAVRFAVQFLGVQACISVYGQIGYLFTNQMTMGGQEMTSDTGHLAQYTLIPHFVWAVLIIVVSLALLGASLWLATRPRSERGGMSVRSER